MNTRKGGDDLTQAVQISRQMIYTFAALNPSELRESSLPEDYFPIEVHQKLYERLKLYDSEGKSSEDWLSSLEVDFAGDASISAELEAIKVGDVHFSAKPHVRSLSERASRRRFEHGLLKILSSARASSVSDARSELQAFMVQESIQEPERAPVDAQWLLQKCYVESHEPLETTVRTGIYELDDAVGHISPGSLFVIGADTGIGKTSFLMRLAYLMVRDGTNVGFISCEDSLETLGHRWVEQMTGIPALAVRKRVLSPGQTQTLKAAAGHSDLTLGGELKFAEAIGASDGQVCAKMQELVTSHACDVVLVDYLQAIGSSKSKSTRREEIHHMVQTMKGAASNLRIPLFLTSQLKRRENVTHPPSMHDLKEAGDVENAAELIVMLHKQDRALSTVYARVAKSKWGGGGEQFEMIRRGSLLIETTDSVRHH